MTRSRTGARSWRWLALILALAMIATACTSADDDSTDTTGADDGTATTAADGSTDTTAGGDTDGDDGDTDGDTGVNNPGTFVFAADDEPLSLDPAEVEAGEYGEAVILQVYDRLVDFAPGGPELVPSLATEVPTDDNGLISEDGLTYTFPIREGVTFHDGSPLTADDVLYSWERIMTSDLPGSSSALLIENVDSMEVIDEFTFQVTLQERNAAFLNSVVTQMVASIVSDEVVEANGGFGEGERNEFMATNPVGTGPYVFDTWNRNENLLFTANGDYWGGAPALDLRIEIVQDPDVRILGLRAGDYDMIETDPSLIGDLTDADGVNIFTGGLLVEPIHIAFNLNATQDIVPPEDTVSGEFFRDPLIRQAFNHAFDYEAFLQGALGGIGDFNTHYIPQGIFGYDEEAPKYTQADPARAEELFREAGVWDEGFTVSVVTEAANLFETAALVLKDSIERINPNFQIRVVAVAEAQFDEAHASDPVPYTMWVKNADPFADPHAFFQAYYHPDGEWGPVHGFRDGFRDPDQIASLIDEAKVEIDTTRRAELYSELQGLLYEDPMWVIAAQEGVANAHRDWVEGFDINTLWPRPNMKFALFDK